MRSPLRSTAANAGYTTRTTQFTISDIDSATQASTPGVTVNSPTSVTFLTGYNTVTGYVARWTKIKCGADGDFTLRNDNGPGISNGYSMDGLMLRETTPANQPPEFSGYALDGTTDKPLEILPAKILARASDPDGDAVSLTGVVSPSAQGGTVALAGTVNYTPPAGFAGTDTFQVELTDARGAIGLGTITVNLSAAPSGGTAMGQNQTHFAINAGQAEMVFRGIPGRSYNIQRSTDMTNWIDLDLVPAGPDGKIPFIDPNPPMPNAYYRTKSN